MILLRSESPSGKCAKLWQQATIEITCRNYSIIACSCHLYMSIVLHAHSFRGEPRCNTSREVAITSPPFYNEPHRSYVLIVTVPHGTTFTSWSQHHFVAIGEPERHMCKSSYCGSKQQ